MTYDAQRRRSAQLDPAAHPGSATDQGNCFSPKLDTAPITQGRDLYGTSTSVDRRHQRRRDADTATTPASRPPYGGVFTINGVNFQPSTRRRTPQRLLRIQRLLGAVTRLRSGQRQDRLTAKGEAAGDHVGSAPTRRTSCKPRFPDQRTRLSAERRARSRSAIGRGAVRRQRGDVANGLQQLQRRHVVVPGVDLTLSSGRRYGRRAVTIAVPKTARAAELIHQLRQRLQRADQRDRLRDRTPGRRHDVRRHERPDAGTQLAAAACCSTTRTSAICAISWSTWSRRWRPPTRHRTIRSRRSG